jgi:hypothetical protein
VDRLALAVALAGAAMVVAWAIQRRQQRPAPTRTGYHVPDLVDRADFDRPDAPWLVAVFTSSTCSTCGGVLDKARQLASDDVAVQDVEVAARHDLHQRYSIDGVPAVIVADRDGVVLASFLGPVTASDLWATVAELREPGSVPDGCDHHGSAPGR